MKRNTLKPPAAPASAESRFAAGALALAFLFPQSTAETWSVKWPVMGCLLLAGSAWFGAKAGMRRGDGISWAWAPLAAWAALSPLWSLYPHRSLVQAIFIVCGMMVVFNGRGRIIPAVLAACILGIGGAELMVQGLQLAGHAAAWRSGIPRLFGSFVNANHHAALLMAAYGTAAARGVCGKRPGRPFLLVLALLFLAGAELSKSRAILLAAPAILGLLWLGKPAGFDRRSFGFLALCSFLLLLSPAGPARRIAGELAGQDQFSWKRSEIWTSAFRMIRERPLAGYGLGGFGDAFPAVRPRRLAIYTTDYAHSEPVQFASETGLIGLGLGIWAAAVIIGILRIPFKADPVRAGLILAGAGVAAFALTDFPMHVPLLSGILILSLTASLPKSKIRDKPATAWVRASLYAVSAALALWMAACGLSEYYFARGARAALSGRTGAAVAAFEDSLRFCPQNPEALNGLGQLAPGGRKENFLAARRLRPGWVPPLNGLFDQALQAGRIPEAETAWMAARKLDPYGFETALMASRLDAAAGRLQESAARLDEMEKLWGGHVDLALARAELEIKKGDFGSAERSIRRVLSLYPMNESARRMLGNLP